MWSLFIPVVGFNLAHAAEPEEVPSVLQGEYRQGPVEPLAPHPWWLQLDDASLDVLMDEALGHAPDLQSVWARVQSARAVSVQAASGLMPELSLDATWNTQPTKSFGFSFQSLGFAGSASVPPTTTPSAPTPPTGTTGSNTSGTGGTPDLTFPEPEPLPDLFHSGQGGLTARWNLDVTGRQALTWRASHLDAQASLGDHRAMAIALSTQVAELYYGIVASQEQYRILVEQRTAQEQLLSLMAMRYETGNASAVQVLQQRQRVAAVAALEPPARARVEVQRRALNILLGRNLNDDLQTVESLPPIQDLPALGLPRDLLAHRPDVLAAQHRDQAARQRTTSAILALAPSLGASASIGRQYTYMDEFDDQAFWSAGAQMSIPLLSGGARHAGIRAARATQSSAQAELHRTLNNARSEVESAIDLDEAHREALARALEGEDAADLLLEESKKRYLAGLENYLAVLTAQDASLSASLSRVQAHRDALSARIQLHDALGGPWVNRWFDGVSR